MPYINVAKPTGTPYTNQPKPANGVNIRAGMITGLMIPLTYAVNRLVGDVYTYSPKPTGTPYTNINKPT